MKKKQIKKKSKKTKKGKYTIEKSAAVGGVAGAGVGLIKGGGIGLAALGGAIGMPLAVPTAGIGIIAGTLVGMYLKNRK